MDATEFYETVIAPNNADKSFLVPAWAVAFAERYADYMAIEFYKLKLKLELANADLRAREVLIEIEHKHQKEG